MIGNHKFKVGQRVRPSRKGIGAHIFTRTREKQSGRVVRVDQFNFPSIVWDGLKTPQKYHPDFIAPDWRQHT